MSEEYDNTNSGAVFKPFPEEKYVLQGKLNINGLDHKVAVVKRKTKEGKGIMKVYTELVALFENDSDNANAPDFTGNCHPHFWQTQEDKLRLAAWVKEKNGNKYLSLQVSEGKVDPDNNNQEKSNSSKETMDNKNNIMDDLEDAIPF